jgi:hypothetical protein
MPNFVRKRNIPDSSASQTFVKNNPDIEAVKLRKSSFHGTNELKENVNGIYITFID